MADRDDKDGSQKAKIILLSAAALVAVLLIVSFVVANRARGERDAARAELEACKQETAKTTVFLDEQMKEIDSLKKQVADLTAKIRAMNAAKSKPAAKTATTKKKTTRSSKGK